jgi:hypothetical protein
MVDIARIEEGVKLRNWLSKRPDVTRQRDWTLVLHRSAMRALPDYIAFLEDEKATRESLSALPILRANLATAATLWSPSRKLKQIAVRAGAVTVQLPKPQNALLAGAQTVAYSAASLAKHSAETAALLKISDAPEYILPEAIEALAQQVRQEITDAALIDTTILDLRAPLWIEPTTEGFPGAEGAWTLAAPTEDIASVWHSAKTWLQAHPGHDFWIRWYEAALQGRPISSNWENHRQILTEIACIPDEDWTRGAEHLAVLIERILAQYVPHAQVALEARLELTEQAARLIEGFEAASNRQLAASKDFIQSVHRQFENLTERYSAQLTQFQEKLTAAIEDQDDKATAQLEELKREAAALMASFRQDQALKAPAALWEDKHETHLTASRWSLGLFLLSLFCIGGGAGFLVYALLHWPEQMTALLTPPWCDITTGTGCTGFSLRGLLVSGAALTGLTVLLWFARLRMKIYLSERHLAQDARERHAFAQTYLGLLENGDTSQEAQQQRSIVYAALFRPSADGMVKDEGGLDPSVTAVLSKLLSK